MSIIALIKKSIVSNYNRLKMFIGCNKCKICGHLYIVNIDFTIADAYTERKLYNSRRLTVVLQMSLDEQLLNKKQFSELIR